MGTVGGGAGLVKVEELKGNMKGLSGYAGVGGVVAVNVSGRKQ